MNRLSGQAFWTLMQTGKRPVGLVVGNCVYRVNNHGWGSHVVEFFAIGTAVVPNEHAEEAQQLPDITPVLDIND